MTAILGSRRADAVKRPLRVVPWSPDPLLLTRTERADAWLWHHPKLHALAAAVLFAGIGFVLVWLAWRAWEQ